MRHRKTFAVASLETSGRWSHQASLNKRFQPLTVKHGRTVTFTDHLS